MVLSSARCIGSLFIKFNSSLKVLDLTCNLDSVANLKSLSSGKLIALNSLIPNLEIYCDIIMNSIKCLYDLCHNTSERNRAI